MLLRLVVKCSTVLMLCLLLLPSAAVAQAEGYVLYLVRHAEKAETQGAERDPPLSACGQARAQFLAGYFANSNLEQVYSSDYQRTRQTAAEIVAQQQLPLAIYQAKEIAALAHQLRERKQNALVVGHSNTIPPLAALLSEQTTAAMHEEEYSRMYRLEIKAGAVHIQVLEQGFSCAL